MLKLIKTTKTSTLDIIPRQQSHGVCNHKVPSSVYSFLHSFNPKFGTKKKILYNAEYLGAGQ